MFVIHILKKEKERKKKKLLKEKEKIILKKVVEFLFFLSLSFFFLFLFFRLFSLSFPLSFSFLFTTDLKYEYVPFFFLLSLLLFHCLKRNRNYVLWSLRDSLICDLFTIFLFAFFLFLPNVSCPNSRHDLAVSCSFFP